MEVNGTSFPHHLLGIIKAISESEFVSFDLEMSGIPSRLPGYPRKTQHATLEDRYAECKAGAERYQILQVGLTCARYDWTHSRYVLRPYNFNISPLVQDRLDVERDITFQAGAIAFLLKNDFQFDLPFREGVPYLSREDADQVKQKRYDHIDKKNVVNDVHLKETDVEALDFVRRAREAIRAWRVTRKSSLEITTHTGLKEQPELPVISRFEKRLVHQLIRSESPDLVAIGRDDHIQIKEFDAEREAEFTRRSKQRVKDQIMAQSGFRWVAEALANGDLNIDPKYFARSTEGDVIAADLSSIKSCLSKSIINLRTRQPVLVGHNMFMDLVYFYRTFFGELPDTLDEFRNVIHALFPKIIDTKYLATFDGGDLHASPALAEIAKELQHQPLPDIIVDATHSKYHNTDAFHEAGFDSLQTATILLRLSANISMNRPAGALSVSSRGSSADSFATAFEELGLNGQDKTQAPELPPIKEESPLPSPEPTKKEKKKRRKKASPSEKKVAPRFATSNRFAALPQDSDTKDDADSDEQGEDEDADAPNPSWQDEPYPIYEVEHPIDEAERDPMERIPDFDSDFWKAFGNRLRIFGTEETLLKIAKWPQ